MNRITLSAGFPALGLAAILGLVFSVCLPFQAEAQQQLLGSISGTVTDSSGASVPKATVKVHNTATNLDVMAETQSNGFYLVPNLPIGTYTVTFSKDGFKSEIHTEVLVQANRTATVSPILQVGALSTTVEVTATPLLNETDTTHGYVLDESVITSTPLGTGSFTQLAILNPGVNADLLAGSGTNTGLGNQAIWANGQRDTSNSFSINAVNTNNLFNGKSASQVTESRFLLNTGQRFLTGGDVQTNLSVYDATGQGLPTPAQETLQELRVNTAMYDATQGANSGAHIELITKAGTNDYHGEVYEYHQTSAWNAAPFFRNASTAIAASDKVPALHNNRFGGTLGGPIVRDKLFFFGSYQGARITDELGGNSTVTVPLHLTDDRSPAGLALVAKQDFGATIDPTKIDPAALKLLQFKLNGAFLIPSAQTTDPAAAKAQGFDALLVAPPSTFSPDQFNANVDYNISAKDRLAVKYFYSNNPATNPFGVSSLLGFTESMAAGSQVASINNTTILGPNLTWGQKVGFVRQRSFASNTQPLTPTDAGISLFGLSKFPNIFIFRSDNTLGRSLGFGSSGGLSNAGFFQNKLDVGSNLSWTHGAHTVYTGFNLTATQLNIINLNNQVATLNFDNFPNFLLGVMNPGFSSFFNGATNRYYRSRDFGVYAQDNFKLRRNLTINVGLRFDREGPLTEKNGLLANFYADRFKYDPATDTILDGGIVIAGNNAALGTSGVSDSTMKGRQWGFGPRFGIVWSPSFVKNIVVRAGFGLYYDRGEFFSEFSPGSGRGFNGPFGVTLALPFTAQIAPSASATLSNPFGSTLPTPPSDPAAITKLLPNIAQIKNKTGPSKGATFLFGGYDPNNVLPYTENWSLDLQWQPWNTWVLSLGYVGNRGLHEILPIPYNQAGIATAQNPIHGETSSYGFNVVPSENVRSFDGGNTDLRVPFLGYSTNAVLYEAEGISSYHALQAGLQKRLSHGLLITASYTWSHALDEQSGLGLFFNGNNPLTPRTSYASSSFDRTHVFIVSYYYQLPTLADEHSLLGKFVNGWGFSGITVAQSGQPYNIVDFSGAVAGIYYSSQVSIVDPILGLAPGVTPQQAMLQGTTGINPANPLLDATKFAFPPPTIAAGQLGVPAGDNVETDWSNGPRNAFRGPFQSRFDFALLKQTKLTERFALKYEVDVFNILNHPSFDVPRNNVSLYSFANPPKPQSIPGFFGLLQSTIGSPRFIQMSLHLTF